MDYENFDLAIELIDQTDRRYRTRVLSSPVGQATAGFELPFTQKELSSFFWVNGRILRQLRSTPTSADNVSLNPREFGAKLYDTVFVGDVRVALARSMDEVERQRKGLRIRLRLSEAPDLADLPWEFLYATDKHRPLSLSPATPLVRYLDLSVAERSLKVQPPLRILCIVSSPSDATEIDVEKEWRHLQNSLGDLQRRKLIALERLPQATFPALRDYLNQHEIHILHFIGHGAFEADRNEGGLFFEDNDGRGQLVSAERLSIQLNNYKSLRLVFLNACESARSGKANNFGGVAQNLVQQGVPAVVAMQFSVSDGAAITLAHQFYQGVANGYPVDTALADARIALHADGDDLEWGTPVLYLRSGDGNLFDLAKPEKEKTSAVSRWRQVSALFSVLAGLVLLGMLFLQGAQWLSSWSILTGRATETAIASPGNTMDAPATTVVSTVATDNLSPSYTPPSTTEAVSVATHLSDFISEVSTIHAFTTTTPQVGDGTRIMVADLSANAPVTVSLHTDEEGKPSAFSLFSMLVMSGTYEDLALAIPEENRPTANARFWIQLFEPNTLTATQRISVELQLETDPKITTSDIITVTTLQIGDGSRIMIDQLSVTNAVTVTLYDDDSGVPSQLPIASTVFAEGSYENVSLMIPEDSQPVQNSNFWIQVYNTGTITAAVSISVMLDLNIDIIGDFVIDPQQISDGSTITLTKLVVYQDTILVGVLGSDPTGQQIKPDDVRVLQSIPGPSRYKNIPIFIPNEKRPMEDSRLWVRLYKETDNPATSPQPVDLILHTVITDFVVQKTQKGNGIILDKVNASKSITVTVRDEHDTLISSMLLEGQRTHENIFLPIPEALRPNQDAQYWVELYAGETAEPLRSEEITLDLDPILDVRLSIRQQNDVPVLELDLIQVSEPVQITLHPDEQQQPSIQEITHIGLSKPGKYDTLSFAIPQSVELAEETVFWYRFFDSQGTEAREPISVTLVMAASPQRDLNIIDEQYSDGTQIEIASIKTDIPLILGLYEDDRGRSSLSILNQLSIRSGEYPNILTSEMLIPIPKEHRPITDTTYWVHVYDTNLEEMMDPISVTLRLLPVIDEFKVASPQVGYGETITISKLSVIEPVTLTLHIEAGGKPGAIITQTIVDTGDHDDIVLLIPSIFRTLEDQTFWVEIRNRRQADPLSSKTITLDLPPIIDLDVAEEQENDGSFIELTKLAVSEIVVVSIRESTSITNTVVYTRIFQPGFYDDVRFNISTERQIQHPVYLFELTNEENIILHSPITVSLVVKLPLPIKPVIWVQDQEREGFNAVLEFVTTPKDAWVAIYEQPSLGSHPLGYVKVDAGETEKLNINFSHRILYGSILRAVLHEDTGLVGQFDYPAADFPFKENNEPVAASFILGFPRIEVDSQQVKNSSITVSEIIAPNDCWLAIYERKSGLLLGYREVLMGRNEKVVIALNKQLLNEQMTNSHELTLIAVLHKINSVDGDKEPPTVDNVLSISKVFSVTE